MTEQKNDGYTFSVDENGPAVRKSMYEADGYWDDAQFSKDWQPGGDWYEDIYETLQANGGSYYVQDSYGQYRQITPNDLYSMSIDTPAGEELREAIAYDTQQANYENDVDNADYDLKDAGKVLVARGALGMWDGVSHGWLKPGLTMSQLVQQSQAALDSEIQSISVDKDDRMRIRLANHDGESYLEVRECTPRQAERLTTLLDDGEEAQADKVWQRLKTPTLPSAMSICETPEDIQLDKTAKLATSILQKAGIEPVLDSRNYRKHTVRINGEGNRIRFTLKEGANERTIIAKTLTAMANYDPKATGDSPEFEKEFRQKTSVYARNLLTSRKNRGISR